MKKFVLMAAAAGCLLAAPALAGTPGAPDRPMVVAEDFCVGPACVGTRDRDEGATGVIAKKAAARSLCASGVATR
jgi:hypothetical protein